MMAKSDERMIWSQGVSAFIATAFAQDTPEAGFRRDGFRKADSLDSTKESSTPRS
jgi:hypothetical protein